MCPAHGGQDFSSNDPLLSTHTIQEYHRGTLHKSTLRGGIPHSRPSQVSLQWTCSNSACFFPSLSATTTILSMVGVALHVVDCSRESVIDNMRPILRSCEVQARAGRWPKRIFPDVQPLSHRDTVLQHLRPLGPWALEGKPSKAR
jgi:hypothetical protein